MGRGEGTYTAGCQNSRPLSGITSEPGIRNLETRRGGDGRWEQRQVLETLLQTSWKGLPSRKIQGGRVQLERQPLRAPGAGPRRHLWREGSEL